MTEPEIPIRPQRELEVSPSRWWNSEKVRTDATRIGKNVTFINLSSQSPRVDVPRHQYPEIEDYLHSTGVTKIDHTVEARTIPVVHLDQPLTFRTLPEDYLRFVFDQLARVEHATPEQRESINRILKSFAEDTSRRAFRGASILTEHDDDIADKFQSIAMYGLDVPPTAIRSGALHMALGNYAEALNYGFPIPGEAFMATQGRQHKTDSVFEIYDLGYDMDKEGGNTAQQGIVYIGNKISKSNGFAVGLRGNETFRDRLIGCISLHYSNP